MSILPQRSASPRQWRYPTVPRPVEDGALLSRRFDHSLQLSSPYEVVDGPSAYLTRGRQIHRQEPHRGWLNQCFEQSSHRSAKAKQTNLREGIGKNDLS